MCLVNFGLSCEFGNGIYNSCSIWLTDEAAWSSEDDFSAGDTGTHECNQKSEDRELKDKLLHKYSGYITSLKHEFSKKTKKGKLPREARQMLLDWWTMHYKWPYPTVVVSSNHCILESRKLYITLDIRFWIFIKFVSALRPRVRASALAFSVELLVPDGKTSWCELRSVELVLQWRC